jgi:LacI family transcriptional regulator
VNAPVTDGPADQVLVRGRPPTINDVARAAGVSRSTTARALRSTGYVAESVRERVVAAAAEIGYVPNAVASSLRSQESRIIGLLVSDLKDPFYSELASGVAHAARSAGYTTILVDSRGSVTEEMDAARAMVGMRVAGVVVTPLTASVSAFLASQRVPVVEADRTFHEETADVVLVDNESSTEQVMRLLLTLGHTRIALLADEIEWTTGAGRYQAYSSCLRSASIPLDPELVARAGAGVEEARTAAVRVLTRPDRPTAVFCANSLLAEGLWRAAADLGLRIPTDLSVVAFDDTPWMSLVSPGITAVAQDPEQMGTVAVGRLLQRIESGTDDVRQTVVPATLRPRGSTAPPRGTSLTPAQAGDHTRTTKDDR